MTACIVCTAGTTSTTRATVGDTSGVVCTDCEFWCDGNVAQPERITG